MVNKIQTLLNVAKTMVKGPSTVSSPNIVSTVSHGIKPQVITDTFSKTIPQDILGIPLKGQRVQDTPIIKMIEQSILHMDKFNPKVSPIYKEILFESVPSHPKGVAYVDMARQYQVSGLPTLMVFKNGQAIERLVGLMPKSSIISIIEKHV